MCIIMSIFHLFFIVANVLCFLNVFYCKILANFDASWAMLARTRDLGLNVDRLSLPGHRAGVKVEYMWTQIL